MIVEEFSRARKCKINGNFLHTIVQMSTIMIKKCINVSIIDPIQLCMIFHLISVISDLIMVIINNVIINLRSLTRQCFFN